MHSFKHFVDLFALPLFVALLTAILAGVFRAFGWRRAARVGLLAAGCIAYLGALDPVGNLLLAPLESQYPAWKEDPSRPAPGYIVVLGAEYAPRGDIPVTAALSDDGLKRIVEGVRLMRHLGSVRMVVSGGAVPGSSASAVGYARLARSLGIADASIIVSDRALDTAAEAHDIGELLGSRPFILVTSAYHMPRAMRLMTRAGTMPIPAPTGQRANGAANHVRHWLPSSGGLRKTELALHEYLGLAAIRTGLD